MASGPDEVRAMLKVATQELAQIRGSATTVDVSNERWAQLATHEALTRVRRRMLHAIRESCDQELEEESEKDPAIYRPSEVERRKAAAGLSPLPEVEEARRCFGRALASAVSGLASCGADKQARQQAFEAKDEFRVSRIQVAEAYARRLQGLEDKLEKQMGEAMLQPASVGNELRTAAVVQAEAREQETRKAETVVRLEEALQARMRETCSAAEQALGEAHAEATKAVGTAFDTFRTQMGTLVFAGGTPPGDALGFVVDFADALAQAEKPARPCKAAF